MNCPLIQNGFIKDTGEFESKHFFDKQFTYGNQLVKSYKRFGKSFNLLIYLGL